MSSIRGFFAYARERYSILLRRRRGLDGPPWTDDPILQRYRFCNVFREDDRTTIWFRETVRERLREHRDVVLATIIFRWFNRVETGQVLVDNQLLRSWDPTIARGALGGLRPLVTGAYIIKTPDGMSKLDGLIWCIDAAWRRRQELTDMLLDARTLEVAHEILLTVPYLGKFMAYEVVTDLTHTRVLQDASDLDTWASLGPGAARGLGRLYGDGPQTYSYNSRSHQLKMLKRCCELLDLSCNPKLWPRVWPRWSMREVEHTLCEFDKYERARLGAGSPRQLFQGSRRAG